MAKKLDMSLQAVQRDVLARADKAQKTKTQIARLQHEVLVSREECKALKALEGQANKSVYVVKTASIVEQVMHEETVYYATYSAAKLGYSASLPREYTTKEDTNFFKLPDGWQLIHAATWTNQVQHVLALFAVRAS